MKVPDDEYTYISLANVWVCNNCGAHADSKDEVKHYPTCSPGESKFWEEYYRESARGPDEDFKY